MATFGPRLVVLWKSLVNTIEAEALGPILSQVFANLFLLFSEGGPETEIVQIYKMLLMEKRSDLRPHFVNLNFLPDDPDLDVINNLVKKENNVTERTRLADMLTLVTKSFDVENLTVKVLTLRKLKQLLRFNQGKVQGLIVGSDQTEPIVSQLNALLMKAIRDSGADDDLALVSGQILGCIGAVDPGRIEQEQDLARGCDDIALSMDDERFALTIIDSLIRAYLQSKEAIDSDSCAFALQEVLKAYDLNTRESTAGLRSPSGRLWNRIPEDQKETLLPFRSSMYSTSKISFKKKGPLFKSSEAMTYSDWVSMWCCKLMDQLRPCKEKTVAEACRAAIRKDVNCAKLVLPYLIASVICQGNADFIDEVLIEVGLVLKAGDVKSHEDQNGLRLIGRKVTLAELDRLAVQTVFSVLDYLNKWLRLKYSQHSASAVPRMKRLDETSKVRAKDKEFAAVETFLSSISQKLLANASFSCQAYARSLMHLENHLRRFPEEIQDSLLDLQRIYGKLHDSDYVRGVVAIQQKEPDIEEKIFEHVTTGNYSDALGCFERFDSGQIEAYGAMMDCYIKLDRPQTVLNLVDGYVKQKPEAEKALEKYRCEAAWQLSRWDEIPNTKSREESFSWRKELSSLLLMAKTKQRQNFFGRLEAVQALVVSPIKAAAMEQEPYQRSYEHVVKLQILDEVEDVAKKVLFASDSDLFSSETAFSDINEMLVSWKYRNEYTKLSLEALDPLLKVRRCLLAMSINKLQNAVKKNFD